MVLKGIWLAIIVLAGMAVAAAAALTSWAIGAGAPAALKAAGAAFLGWSTLGLACIVIFFE
jgi:hypothetical protein